MHTSLGDGELDMEEVIKQLVKKVVKVAAISDHNNVCGVKKAIELGEKYGVKIIPAVEFSCFRQVSSSGLGIDSHILAYFFDPEDETLFNIAQEHATQIQLVFYAHMMNLVDYLEEKGKLSEAIASLGGYKDLRSEDIIKKSFIEQTTHYLEIYKKTDIDFMAERVESMLGSVKDSDISDFISLLRMINSVDSKYELNENEKSLIKKLLVIHTCQTVTTTAKVWKEALETYIREKMDDSDAPDEFFWGWSNLPNVNVPVIDRSPKELIKAIHKAGGIAVLAHPRWYPDIVLPNGDWNGDGYRLMNDYVEELSTYGLDGLEVYTHWEDSKKDGYFLETAERLNLVVSYGTDCHFRGKEKLGLGMNGNFYMPYQRLSELFAKVSKLRETLSLKQSIGFSKSALKGNI